MGLGLEIRAQIDSENAKGLLLINGGAAVALLAFLPSILGKPGLSSVSQAVLYALCAFLIGLAAAFTHNRLRRVCSMVWEGSGYQPARCRFLPSWVTKREPCVCFVSVSIMWLSLIAFFVGGSIVAFGGFKIVGYKDAASTASCWQLQELQAQVFRVNTCTGSFELIKLPAPLHNQSLKADVAKVTPP
jgi:hypothetical protein